MASSSTAGGTSIAANVACSALAPAIAAIATNPADVAKTRLNMERELQPAGAPQRYSGMLDCISKLWRAEGLAGVQRGLGFAIVREASKNSFRIGLYEPLAAVLDADRARAEGGPAPMRTRVLAGAITGGFAALICNPLDLCKALIQLSPDSPIFRPAGAAGSAAAAAPAPAQKPMQQAAGALRRLVGAHGVAALWMRGVVPNVYRSALATCTALPANARLKELCAERFPSLAPVTRDASCALAASVVVTLIINPMDLVRTRLFAQPDSGRAASGGATPGRLYNGALHCIWRVASVEGPLAFWKGATAAFWRVGPHQTLTFVLLGQLRRVEARWSAERRARGS